MQRTRSAGFTLIELVAVIVVASVGMVGLATMFSNTNLGLARATDEQAASQYVQECAELVLQTRRDYGITSGRLVDTMCNASVLSGYSRDLRLPAVYTGNGTGLCRNGIVCRNVIVTVCAGNVLPCPANATSASASFTMVNY
jgi:prepilin-type N-terminal cleavage/methylation domain-containing protein